MEKEEDNEEHKPLSYENTEVSVTVEVRRDGAEFYPITVTCRKESVKGCFTYAEVLHNVSKLADSTKRKAQGDLAALIDIEGVNRRAAQEERNAMIDIIAGGGESP